MFNKRGQELSIGTLVLIVLGIIVLVLLILGFSLGWSNLWNKVNIFQGGSDLESIIQACKISGDAGSKYSYCSDFKKVTLDGSTQYITCSDSRVQSQMGGAKLNCDGNERDLKVLSLAVAGKLDGQTLYNGQKLPSQPTTKPACADVLNGLGINNLGAPVAPATIASCDSTSSVDVSSMVAGLAANRKCCVTIKALAS